MQTVVFDRWFKQRFKQWINRRLPAQRSIFLTRKNVFIFPSKSGFAFLLVITLLWLIATNYENNLIFAFTFLLTSLFVVSILHTFSNLAGLTITTLGSTPAFVGEDAEFRLMIERRGQRWHENLLFSWPTVAPQIVSLTEQSQQKIKLYLKASHRGLFKPSRILIATYYPLGLLRAWTWLDLDTVCLVYPKPIKPGPIPAAQGTGEEGSYSNSPGSEDFYGLKTYQTGDSPKHVAWKQYARGRGLHTKEYRSSIDRRLWLDWDYFGGMNRESRLSCLCYWVLAAARTQESYGLRLPNLEIAPDKGFAHRDRLLKALALFESESVER